MFAASGASASSTPTSTAECVSPAIGELPPLRMLVAVRAMAPVAAKPPSSAQAAAMNGCENAWAG